MQKEPNTTDNKVEVDTSIGVTTEKDADGKRDYGVKGKIGYTHFPKLTHKATPAMNKITGLRMGDKDTMVKMRFVHYKNL